MALAKEGIEDPEPDGRLLRRKEKKDKKPAGKAKAKAKGKCKAKAKGKKKAKSTPDDGGFLVAQKCLCAYSIWATCMHE